MHSEHYRYDNRPAGSPPPEDPPPSPRWATRVAGRSTPGDWKFHHVKGHAVNAFNRGMPRNWTWSTPTVELWWLNDDGEWELIDAKGEDK